MEKLRLQNLVLVMLVFLGTLVSACGGGDTASIRKGSLVPPTITTHPSDQTVTEGHTAEFSVEATSSETLSYQWQRSDDDGKTWSAINEATKSSYTTPVTTMEDSGAQFICVVTNEIGSVDSNMAVLTVKMMQPSAFALTFPADEASGVGLQPTLRWEESTGATSYTLVVADNAGFADPVVDETDITETSFEIPQPLATGVTYRWRVTAHNAGGDTQCNADFSFTSESGRHTVIFDSQEGSEVNSQTVEHGGKVMEPSDPTRTLYAFGGWYKEAAGTNAWDFDDDIVTEDTTLYAKWAVNEYTLTYMAGANGSISGDSPQTVAHGGSGTAVTAVPANGYYFVKWSDDVLTATRMDTNVTGDIIVTATFAINQYTLTYTAGANGSISGDSPQTVAHGGSGAAVTAVPAIGHYFVKWSDDVQTATRTDTNVTEDISVTASFAVYPDGYVYVSPGTFTMGSPAGESGHQTDETQHEVTISKAFLLKDTEVTQGEWKAAYGGWNPSGFSTCGDTCPVEQVSRYDLLAYANKLSLAASLTPCYSFAAVKCRHVEDPPDGTDYAYCMDATHGGINPATVTLNGVATPYLCMGYRLPTESEWEYAARAGDARATYNGNLDSGHLGCEASNTALDPIAWFCGNSSGKTHEAKGKQANAWGLYDMLGNVYEWVWDRYGPYPTGTVGNPDIDPTGADTGSEWVIRGGTGGHGAQYARAAFRGDLGTGILINFLGFRLARSLP